TTVAGNGKPGSCPEGSSATQSCLNNPEGVAVDGNGNVYITDQSNNRIRRLAPNGTMTTFAGNGKQDYCGDGLPATQACLNQPNGLTFDNAGNLYVADWGNARIRKISTNGLISTFAGGGARAGRTADGFPATQAKIGVPLGIVTDTSGNVYFSDGFSNL